MFQTDLTLQRQLFAFTPRDLLPGDSDVWLYVDLFDAINVEEFDWSYSRQGQAAKDPRLMLRTIFYGLAHGVRSGRALAVSCQNDVRYLVLCGDLHPDARTIHRFIQRHEKRMGDVFTQIVQLGVKLGLARLGRIAIDGTRLKANTSKYKAMSYERMNPAIDQLKQELRSLKKDLKKLTDEELKLSHIPDEIMRRKDRLAKIEAAKAALEAEKGDKIKSSDQKSFHDHDALPMAAKGKEFQYGYNAQAAVDEDNQLIVGCTIHDNQADSEAVAPLLAEVKKNTGESPSEVLADNGYRSGADLLAIESHGATPYVALGQGESATAHSVDDQLTPGDNDHQYYCIAGKELPVTTRRSDGSTEITVPPSFCATCHHQDNCQLFRKKEGKTYTVRNRREWNAVQANRKRMRGTGRGVFRRRKAIVEPVFGNVKNKGLKIHVKGRTKVATWWTMVCTALNVEKLVNHLAEIRALGIEPMMQGLSHVVRCMVHIATNCAFALRQSGMCDFSSVPCLPQGECAPRS